MREDFYHYNNYELIYYYKEGSEEALEIIVWKYSFLIKNKIRRLSIPKFYWDDFYQEGLMMLYKAIKSFDEAYKKSFTNYFDMLLTRRLITLMRKEWQAYQVSILEDLDMLEEETERNDLEIDLNQDFKFSSLEKKVFEYLYIEGLNYDEIASLLNLSKTQLFNTRNRVIKKIKKRLNNGS